MTSDLLSRWISVAANVGVIAGLVFVALEIQTNTEPNSIAMNQAYSSNWLQINNALANSRELSELFERGLADEEFDRAEARQFRHLVSMYLTQSFLMLRLHDNGIISEQEAREAFRALREYAQRGRFRKHVADGVMDPRRRGLILDPEGLDKWLNETN
jgi:hypothetical protein